MAMNETTPWFNMESTSHTALRHTPYDASWRVLALAAIPGAESFHGSVERLR